jgi:hypothetical protein
MVDLASAKRRLWKLVRFPSVSANGVQLAFYRAMSAASPNSRVSLWGQATGTTSLLSYSEMEVAARAYLVYLSRSPAQASAMQDWIGTDDLIGFGEQHALVGAEQERLEGGHGAVQPRVVEAPVAMHTLEVAARSDACRAPVVAVVIEDVEVPPIEVAPVVLEPERQEDRLVLDNRERRAFSHSRLSRPPLKFSGGSGGLVLLCYFRSSTSFSFSIHFR